MEVNTLQMLGVKTQLRSFLALQTETVRNANSTSSFLTRVYSTEKNSTKMKKNFKVFIKI